jgi:hypothetical protein
MFKDLVDGRITVERLSKDTLDVLVTEYGSSPNTAGRARDEAIAEFSEFQNSKRPKTLKNSE